MVAPLRHTADLADLTDEELLDVMRAIRRASALLGEVAHPHGFNIGINLGKAAGAGIEEHLHVHIVPRWNGDTNFMSVTGEVRVIPDGLMESYDRLAAALKAGA
jgi:ATP adenylyltransferase